MQRLLSVSRYRDPSQKVETCFGIDDMNGGGDRKRRFRFCSLLLASTPADSRHHQRHEDATQQSDLCAQRDRENGTQEEGPEILSHRSPQDGKISELNVMASQDVPF